MPVVGLQQQSDWENNAYVLTTTRVLVIVGVAYLFRSLYQWARPVVERFPLTNLLPWAIGNTSSSSLTPPPLVIFTSFSPPPTLPSFLLQLVLLLAPSSSLSLSPPHLHFPSHCWMKVVLPADAAVDPAVAAAPTNVDLSLDDLVPGSPSTLNIDADLSNTASVRPPQPSYDPGRRPQGAPARPHPSLQSHQCSTLSDIRTPTSSRTVASNDESGSGGSAQGAIGGDGQSM